MIVIEGPDNSGKSTLAQYVSGITGLRVRESEGPPKSNEEIDDRIRRYLNTAPCIFVRHPIISNPIYSRMREDSWTLKPEFLSRFKSTAPFLVYCDPGNRGLSGHQEKDYDTPEHLAKLIERYAWVLNEYRLWAAQEAHLIYRIGDNMGFVARAYRAFRGQTT